MTEQFQSSFARNFRSIIRWRNASGETIPPYAVVQADSYDANGLFYDVVKPNDEGNLYFINGDIAVPDGNHGTSLPWDGNAIPAQFEESDHEFATGAEPVPDQWTLGEGGMFTLVSDIDTSTGMNVGSILFNAGRGGGSGAVILFEIVYLDNACKDYVQTEVLGAPCNDDSIKLGDELDVFDEAGCFFNLPDEEFTNLVGVKGFASKMLLLPEEASGGCPEKPECRWVIIQLCCPDLL